MGPDINQLILRAWTDAILDYASTKLAPEEQEDFVLEKIDGLERDFRAYLVFDAEAWTIDIYMADGYTN